MKNTINGIELKEMFAAATRWLEKIVPDINALNVYPVPDGDCGTNMLFTMRASLAEAEQVRDERAYLVAQAMAKGALMGARGNSGVILSQIWRGLASSIDEKLVINGRAMAEALREAAQTAYHALSNPVEGTILTVIKDAAAAACQKASIKGATLITVMETSVEAARESVVKTPRLLAVLKEAGVVDAGGHGLYTLLEGALLYLKGDMDNRSPQLVATNLVALPQPTQTDIEEEAYGFCTQFLLRGKELDVQAFREQLQDLGKSLIVVGDADTVRVHIHTLEPEKITRLAVRLGSISDIDIRNMDEQHKDFLLMHREKATRPRTAVVAVCNGEGMTNVFSSLGVSAVVPGGQSMNPSTLDILQAVEAVPSNNVIVLPNNKNIVLTASQVQSLTKKKVKVIPTETVAQGVTAMVAFTAEADFVDNARHMEAAKANVKTIEITRATRSTHFNGLKVKAGQAIGLTDGKLLAAADREEDVIFDLLGRLDTSASSITTIYHGADTETGEAEAIAKSIRRKYPNLEIEVIKGGQPHYSYIISLE